MNLMGYVILASIVLRVLSLLHLLMVLLEKSVLKVIIVPWGLNILRIVLLGNIIQPPKRVSLLIALIACLENIAPEVRMHSPLA